MPKKTEEKNVKGKKTTSKASTKTVSAKKVAKKEAVKVENIKEAVVVKEETKKGNKKESILNNTPFVVCLCVIVLLVAILIFVLCTKRVPVTSKGNEVVAKINGKTITANDLYLSLKDEYGVNELINVIDEHIAEKEVTITKDDEKYVQEVVDYYKEMAEYYKTDLEGLLKDYVGIAGVTTEEEFYNFVLKDYKKTLAIQKFIGEEATEKELKEYYKENYSDSLTVKHILIEVDKEAKDADKEAKKAYDTAVKLIQKLNKTDKEKLDKKFEELAENNSDDTATYSNGGLVENFKKSEVDEAFWKASEKLKDGEYTKEPVKSSFGYHIILKVSTKKVEAFKDIKKDVIKSYAESLLNSDTNLFNKKWAELREKYDLSIKDDFIKKSYKETIKSLTETKTEE